jgi:hypothetical protein
MSWEDKGVGWKKPIQLPLFKTFSPAKPGDAETDNFDKSPKRQ